jgi:hypothetical protein
VRFILQHCGESIAADVPAHQAGEGGSTPTSPLQKAEWEVRPCDLSIAQSLTARFHYSGGGSNTGTLTCGLWQRSAWLDIDCHGASWWIPPTKSAGAFSHPENPQGVLALSRLVVVPDAPKNAASFLLRHSMRFIDRGRWPVLVTYADEWQGHTGGIYKALKDAGWEEAGWTKPERTYTLEGRMVSRKKGPKTLTHAEMIAAGCVLIGSFRRKRFVNRKVR